MAELLKDQFGSDKAKTIANELAKVFPNFPERSFVKTVLQNDFDALSLTGRGWRIAEALHQYLPKDYTKAIDILIQSLGPKLKRPENQGMAPFHYMPHVFFVAKYGLGHFEESMRAQYELTQRFTAEFSIRPFLIHHQEKTLKRLQKWARDPNLHVRRLVSEGTRPRLPWAQRLPAFQKDPRPVLSLLEKLKDDSDIYVRKSVANNLNDIGKDNPGLLIKTGKRWSKGASSERKWILRHGFRSLIKSGNLEALSMLGYKGGQKLEISGSSISPKRPKKGQKVTVGVTIKNKASFKQKVMVDYRIHFVKSNGRTSLKVFKLSSMSLATGELSSLEKSLSLKEMTTRKHFPGFHKVEILLNGKIHPIGGFHLLNGGK